jgi:hypothetical protein
LRYRDRDVGAIPLGGYRLKAASAAV